MHQTQKCVLCSVDVNYSFHKYILLLLLLLHSGYTYLARQSVWLSSDLQQKEVASQLIQPRQPQEEGSVIAGERQSRDVRGFSFRPLQINKSAAGASPRQLGPFPSGGITEPAPADWDIDIKLTETRDKATKTHRAPSSSLPFVSFFFSSQQ